MRAMNAASALISEAYSKMDGENFLDIEDPVIEELIDLLEDPDPWERILVGRDLPNLIGRPEAFDHVMTLMYDDDPIVRKEIAFSVGMLGYRPVEMLVLLMLSDPNNEVRCMAIASLSLVGDHRAIEPLIAMLDFDDPEVILAAITCLGKIGDLRAIGPLLSFDRVYDTVVGRMLPTSAEHSAKMIIERLGDEGGYED